MGRSTSRLEGKAGVPIYEFLKVQMLNSSKEKSKCFR